MVLISKDGSLYGRLFHLFLFVIGISIGLVFVLCFKLNFSYVPLFSLPLSISKSPVPLLEPPSPLLSQPTQQLSPLPPPLPPLSSPPPPPVLPPSPPPVLPPPPPPVLSLQEINTSHESLVAITPENASNGTSDDTSNNDALLSNNETFPPPPILSLEENTSHESLVAITLENASNGTSNDTSNNDVLLSNNETYSVTHNMSDGELFSIASKVLDNFVSENFTVPKVAFMFLTGWSLPLAPLWDRFFNGHEGMFSVYVHTHPSYNDSIPEDSAFFGRKIPSQPVYWGTMSMIDAERRLLANALLDPSNQRFVLLSDSCIPLFNFSTVYTHLLGTKHSFLGSFDDPRKVGRGRYNHQMWPNITIEQWRKGSQWFEIHRDLAAQIVSDQKYYKLFEEFCHMPCYNDEHYLPTLVNIISPEMNTNRSVTWVDWSRGGPHPKRFGWIDVKAELLNHIKYAYECDYNGNVTNVCFLFARKFIPNTLKPLMKFAPWLLGFG